MYITSCILLPVYCFPYIASRILLPVYYFMYITSLFQQVLSTTIHDNHRLHEPRLGILQFSISGRVPKKYGVGINKMESVKVRVV